MIQIATIPYSKQYKFHYFSQTLALKVILYGLSLLLPFFIVFSVNNFYLSFTDNITTNPSITYDYNYHLIIETSDTTYTYSTLYAIQPRKAISFSYEYNQNLLTHTFDFWFSKPVNERVTKVSLLTFYQYTTNVVSNAFGMVMAEGNGYNIADLNIVGDMKIENGLNKLTDPPTLNILSTYGYRFPQAMLALQKDYKTYLRSTTDFVATNMPSNIMKFQFKLKAPSIVFYQQSASILGQLVWSFMQYFPIACVFWFISKWLLTFLLRENVISRVVIHDKL